MASTLSSSVVNRVSSVCCIGGWPGIHGHGWSTSPGAPAVSAGTPPVFGQLGAPACFGHAAAAGGGKAATATTRRPALAPPLSALAPPRSAGWGSAGPRAAGPRAAGPLRRCWAAAAALLGRCAAGPPALFTSSYSDSSSANSSSSSVGDGGSRAQDAPPTKGGIARGSRTTSPSRGSARPSRGSARLNFEPNWLRNCGYLVLLIIIYSLFRIHYYYYSSLLPYPPPRPPPYPPPRPPAPPFPQHVDRVGVPSLPFNALKAPLRRLGVGCFSGAEAPPRHRRWQRGDFQLQAPISALRGGYDFLNFRFLKLSKLMDLSWVSIS